MYSIYCVANSESIQRPSRSLDTLLASKFNNSENNAGIFTQSTVINSYYNRYCIAYYLIIFPMVKGINVPAWLNAFSIISIEQTQFSMYSMVSCPRRCDQAFNSYRHFKVMWPLSHFLTLYKMGAAFYKIGSNYEVNNNWRSTFLSRSAHHSILCLRIFTYIGLSAHNGIKCVFNYVYQILERPWQPDDLRRSLRLRPRL